MLDFERFEEMAARFEFEDGMSRLGAEMKAATAQGVQRWEAMKCEQRARYFNETGSASATSTATSERPARNAARAAGKSATPAYRSASSPTASSGIAGTAT